MRILVIDQTGAIGREVARQANRLGHQVHGIRGDANILALLTENTLKYDLVYDCVGSREISAGILKWAEQTAQKKGVLFSNTSVYPLTKQQQPGRLAESDAKMWGAGAEQIVLERKAADGGFLVFRPFEVYGEASHGVFRQTWRALTAPGKIKLRNCGKVLDFIHVSDVVGAVTVALDQGWDKGPVNLCTGIPTAVDELAQMMDESTADRVSCSLDGTQFTCGDPTLMAELWTVKISLAEGIRYEAGSTSIFVAGKPRNR